MKSLPKTPRHVKPNLPELATDPNLVDTIRKDIARMRLVGEFNNGLLIYFTYTSRILQNPGAVVVCGASGSGKTTLLERVARLFPAEVKIESMSHSEASWFNVEDPGWYRHKIVICGERKHSTDDKARDAGALVRQMLSERRITRRVSLWDDQAKKWATRWQEFEGPIAYAETTTSKAIFSEDLNRMLQLFTDASDEQKRRVLESVGSQYEKEAEREDIGAVLKRHHDFQLHLQKSPPKRVVIPYHRGITSNMPRQMEGVARMTQHLFTVIEAIAVLHQHMREGDAETVTATIDDYRLARDLLLQPFRTAQGLKDGDRAVDTLWARFGSEPFSGATVAGVVKTANRMATSRLLDKLVKAGVLVRVEESAGSKAATYRFSKDAPVGADTGLPTVSQVLRGA